MFPAFTEPQRWSGHRGVDRNVVPAVSNISLDRPSHRLSTGTRYLPLSETLLHFASFRHYRITFRLPNQVEAPIREVQILS